MIEEKFVICETSFDLFTDLLTHFSWAMKSIAIRLSIFLMVTGTCSLANQRFSATEFSETRNNVTNLQPPQISRIIIRNSGHNGNKEINLKGSKRVASEPAVNDTVERQDVSPAARSLLVLMNWPPRDTHRPRPIRIRHPASHGYSHRSHNGALNRTSSTNQHIEVNSGLNLRLIGSHNVNEGVVRVKVNDQWGYICKDDHWNENDARVICRQIGFSSTAENASTLQTRRVGPRESFAISRVSCSGLEDEIQDCAYNTSASCASSRAVKVRCSLNPGCEDGWLASNGFCYKFVNRTATFDQAEAGCRFLESYLVKIDTQQESNFVSSMLMAERTVGSVWTSGQKINLDGLHEWRWLGLSHAIQFTKWFPGLQSAGLRSQPNNLWNHSCIALSKAFHDINGFTQDVGYYFWMTLPCVQSLPYVCKKVIQTNDCYEGIGSDYRGMAFITTRASLCQKWTESNLINPTTHQNAGLGDHNYCRNPDGDERPWCWVDAAQGKYGYCALSSCPRRDPVLSTPSSTDVPLIKVRLRDGRHGHEGRVEVWYEGQWGNVCHDQ